MTRLTGQCLCGAVRYAIEAEKTELDACHCSRCRRWAGGPLMTLEHKGAVNFSGGESIGIYPSSDVVERGFCKVCGSTLFTRIQGDDHYFLAAGTIAETEHLELAVEIFIDDKPAYYAFANDTEKMTGAEFMAAWEAKEPK